MMAGMTTVEERLQKIIARAGVASRRRAEDLIRAGHVTVNGRVTTELGTKADPERDSIKVGGKLLRLPQEKLYLMLNKPPRCVATMSDPEGRRTLRDFVGTVGGRVFPIGRLDYHAEGLLLLTTDGELAQALLQASGLRQTYWLKVKGVLGAGDLANLQHKTGARLRPLKSGNNPWYEASFTGARRDLLRKKLAQMEHPVEKLKRVGLANLELGNLAPGEYRFLAPEEVAALRRAIARERKPKGKQPPRNEG